MTTTDTPPAEPIDSEPSSRPRVRRRWWRVLVGGVIALLALNLIASLIATQLPQPLVWPRYEVQDKVDDLVARGADGCLDTVVVGTSIANAAIDARSLGDAIGRPGRVYNAALGGSGVQALPLWLDDVVLPTACPDRVVVAVSPRDLNDSNLSSTFVPRYLDSLGRAEITGTESIADRIYLWSLRNVGLVRLRQSYHEPASAIAWLRGERGPWRRINDADGTLRRFRALTYDDSEARRRNDEQVVFANFTAGGVKTEAMIDAMDLAATAGAEVVVVMLPFTQAETTALLPDGDDDLAEYRAAVREAAGAVGATVVDLEGVATSRESFADDYHVNGAGQAAVTAALSEWLGGA